MISDIQGNDVSFTFELTTPACPLKDSLENDARTALARAVPSIGTVGQLDAPRRRATRPPKRCGDAGCEKYHRHRKRQRRRSGKSTVAVNIAVALAADGARVGFIDADITGPKCATHVRFARQTAAGVRTMAQNVDSVGRVRGESDEHQFVCQSADCRRMAWSDGIGRT